jgi:hypothetical protein
MTLTLRKRPLPLHAMGPGDLALDFAHRWWQARRDGGLLPPRSAVDTPEFRLLVVGTSWIDLTSPDPAAWQLGAIAATLRRLAAPEAAHAVAEAEASLRQDLQALRFTGSALLQDLVFTGPAASETYRQLLLPHADDGVRVRDVLAVVLRPEAARRPASSRCQV